MIVNISAAIIAAFGAASAQERQCDAARVSSFSGQVEVRGADGRPIELRRDLVLCPGDSVATGATGGVTLYFTEKDTALTLDNDAELTIPGDKRSGVDATLFSGIVRLVSSVRTNFTIGSDYVTAGIDGTELTMHAVRGVGAVVAVLEGDVTARRGDAAIMLPRNHVSFASAAGGLADVTGQDPAGLPPVFRPYVVNPAGAADWAVYFPPALIADGAAAGQVEAARLLSSGDYAAAEAALDCAAPADSAAAALCAMSAVALNDRARLRAYADRPLGGDPASEVAQSYVYQSLGLLSPARDAAARAVGHGGTGPLAAHAWARLAEVDLILGDREAATAAARTAADMGAPLGHAMLGFAELANADFAAAEAEFEIAAAGDQSPLPILGLGLAKIRQGDLTGGRRDLETAVALDPNRADLRVWLGRAYYEEGLPDKARAQYDMAKQRDPDDPNAYFFSALERYAANDPIGALREVQAAETAGAGRSVLRSSAGLAEDTAVRGAALGRVYDTLGFNNIAQRAGAAAVDRDPTNPEAHRFLADVYRTRKGHEIAQTSEMLRADLLSPPSKSPLQAQLGETQFGLLETSGPTGVTFSEFAPLFDGNGVSVFGTVNGGTQDTFGHEASVAILQDNFSLAFSEFYTGTQGYRANNDIEQFVAAGQVKYAPSPWLTFFGEYRYLDSELGDRQLGFFLDENFSPDVNVDFRRDSARFGFRADALGGTILGLGTWASFETRKTDPDIIAFGPFSFNLGTDIDETSEEFLGAELQYIGEHRGVDYTVGFTLSSIDGEFTDEFVGDLLPSIPPTTTDDDHEQASAYAYASFNYPMNVRWTLGGSVEHFDDDGFGSETRFHPKAGVEAELFDGLTFRAAYTSATKRRLVLDQTLEPTTVAGFNQFFDTFNGARIDQAGVALDAQVTPAFHIGAEAAMRWYDWPDSGTDTDLEEQSFRIYGGYLLTDRIALSGEAVFEHYDDKAREYFEKLDTFSAPLSVRYFDPSGLFAGATATFVYQDYTDLNGINRDDSTVLADFSVGYRLPDRRGVVSIDVLNAFDQSFDFQERTLSPSSINAPTFARELTVIGRLTLSY